MKTAALVLAAVLASVLGGCGADERQIGAQEPLLEQDKGGNLILYVSNQSSAISPVDIGIRVDGKKAVSADFAFDDPNSHFSQHNYVACTFRLAPGKHTLAAVSKKGSAKMKSEFEITDKHWVGVNYWYDPKQSEKKKFSFDIQDAPVGFD